MRPINEGAEGILSQEFKVLDHGFISLIDYMGTDICVEKAARQSYLTQDEVRTYPETRGLLRYLMRENHTSPFEMAELKFQVRVPMGIWRQWVRHRTANINEASGRYIVLDEKLYIPELSRMNKQSESSKQGSSKEVVKFAEKLQERFRESVKRSYEDYNWLVENDLAKEISRFAVPLSLYVDAVWKIDLHNLFHFLKLRLGTHAQWEIQQYAQAIEKIVEKSYPISYEAFVDYKRDSVTLSRMEWEVVRGLLTRDMSNHNLESTLRADKEYAEEVLKGLYSKNQREIWVKRLEEINHELSLPILKTESNIESALKSLLCSKREIEEFKEKLGIS